jgi:predicted outer membrane protein
MTIKMISVALALALAPSLGLAQACDYGKDKQAMTCAPGSSYDETSKSCVATTG